MLKRTCSMLLCLTCALPVAARAVAPDVFYQATDFAQVRKVDAHVHANAGSDAFLAQARADGFELLSINVDYPDFPPIERQRALALELAARDPQHFHWAGTFSMQGFGTREWLSRTLARIKQDAALGARAVKIWKNVGMVERGVDGKLIMLDDSRLEPLVQAVQQSGLALIDHQGEPYNCWLPLNKMTTANDREYFRNHPQYHAWLHPEQPRYEALMAVRDRFVAAHPRLRFVGAHMASLEWNVDLLAAFLDQHPGATVDLAARMSQVQYQSLRDHKRVRDFFVRYQDRLLYGTDLTHAPDGADAAFRRDAHAFWWSDWRYLATAETQRVDDLDATVKGLHLP
ncbi:MAG TPA: amidohydrolase, partial [Rhodanobacteraceae bacterium]|nr:amidohydrolase [Rhodanobacteraceae bacterium]